MEIIIKIPEEQYDAILFASQNRKPIKKPRSASDICFMVVVNGKPLPKGHGRLIDADEVDDAIYKCFEGIQCYDGTGYDIYSNSKESINKIPTIIEADIEV